MMDFTGLVLGFLTGILAPPVLTALLWRSSRGSGASRPARAAAVTAVALGATALLAAVVDAAWHERDAVWAAMALAPISLAGSVAVALRSGWAWLLLAPALGWLWFSFDVMTAGR